MTDASALEVTPAHATGLGDLPVEGRSLWHDAWRRLLRNKMAVASLIVLALIALASIFGPYALP